jgi:hypothetical protein
MNQRRVAGAELRLWPPPLLRRSYSLWIVQRKKAGDLPRVTYQFIHCELDRRELLIQVALSSARRLATNL